MSPTRIRKAVIPAAGLGTRFLPATKAIPKEMLPLLDKPGIQYVVEEAAASGMDDILFITGRNKYALENHFDRALELEAELMRRDKLDFVEAVRKPSEIANIHYVRQGEPLGLGHAILKAEHHISGESFAVLLADDILVEAKDFLDSMVSAHIKTNCHIIALMEVPANQIHLYGCAEIGDIRPDGLVEVTNLIEKPTAADAPSSFAVIGRYILEPAIFDAIRSTAGSSTEEVQLTDALAKEASNPLGSRVFGLVYKGVRYDTGDKLSYIKANIDLALKSPEFGPYLKKWLRDTEL